MGRMLDALRRIESRHAASRGPGGQPATTEEEAVHADSSEVLSAASPPTDEAATRKAERFTEDNHKTPPPATFAAETASDANGPPIAAASSSSDTTTPRPAASAAVDNRQAVSRLLEAPEPTTPACWVSPREVGGSEAMRDLERSFEAFEAFEQAVDALARELRPSPHDCGRDRHAGNAPVRVSDADDGPHVHWVVVPDAPPPAATSVDHDDLVARPAMSLYWSEYIESPQAAVVPRAMRPPSSSNAADSEQPFALTVDFHTAVAPEPPEQAPSATDAADDVRTGTLRDNDGEQAFNRQGAHAKGDRAKGTDAVADRTAVDKPSAQPPIRRYVAQDAQKHRATVVDDEPAAPVTIRFPESVQSDTTTRRATSKLRDIKRLDLYKRLCDHLSQTFDPAGWQTIGWTGATDDDGKTTVVEALCRLWASQQRGEVLAVDAHPKAWGLARRLGYEEGNGLTDVLWGRVRWQKAIGRSLLDGLYVLPPGAGKFPAEADIEACWPDLLTQWRREFRYVVVNIGHDAAIPQVALGRYCDGLFFVVRPRQTPRNEAILCVNRLRKAAARWVATLVVDTALAETG